MSDTKPDMRACPDCEGCGRMPALVNRGPAGCRWETIDCLTCNGAGTMPALAYAELLGRRLRGNELRSQRMERGESLREAAKRLGMAPERLSALEHGRELPR